MPRGEEALDGIEVAMGEPIDESSGGYPTGE
jgi:hypothetical protein